MNGGTYTFTINVNGMQAAGTLNTVAQSALSAVSSFDSLGNSLRRIGESAFVFNQINQGLQSVKAGLNEAIMPGFALNTSLMDLSAVTGQTGKGLKEIEMYARSAAKEFGGSAADGVEAYKLVLSQLSPEIAKVPSALAEMGRHIKTTSKTMGNDTRAAAEVMTTAMNQFQVSLTDPIRAAKEMGLMMNIMAAAAKEGSAELFAIKNALEQSGMAAKAAGVSFAETNAAIQVLDKAGKKGSEGGVALRNVLATLGQGRFLPKDVLEEFRAAGISVDSLTDKSLSLADRLKPLQKVMADDALITKLFGKENANAALALLSGIQAMEGYTSVIQGTETATLQAQTVMGGYAEKMSRMQAWIDDLKISLFNFAGGIMPYVNGVITFFQTATSVVIGLNALATFSESAWAKAIARRTKEMYKGSVAMVASAKAMGVFNLFTLASVATTYAFSFALKAVGRAIYAIPIVGWVAAGITLLITAFKILWDKCEGFRRILFAAWEVVKAVFFNIGIVIKSLWDNIIKPYVMLWWNLVKIVAKGISEAMKWCWDGIVAGLSVVGDFFAAIWEGITAGASAVGSFFSGVWMWITESAGGVYSFIVDIFSKIAAPLRQVFDPVIEFVSRMFDKIANAFGKVFGWIKSMWNTLFPKEQFKDFGEAAKTGLALGSESWQKSQEAKKRAGVPVIPPLEESLSTATVVKTAIAAKKEKSKGYTEKADLVNVKGSTDYAAIVAKLAPVRIAGLSVPAVPPATGKAAAPVVDAAARFNPKMQEYGKQPDNHLPAIAENVRRIAASVALIASIAVPATAARQVADVQERSSETIAAITPVPALSPVAPRSLQDRRQAGEKQVNFEKFCENITISLPAGTVAGQADDLLRELMKRINQARNDY